MRPFLRTLLMGVSLATMAGCGDVNIVADPPVATQNPQVTLNFALLGRAAGKACVAQVSGARSAESTLIKAGYSKTKTTGTNAYFARSLKGGSKTIIGGNPLGAVNVNLPLKAERSGRRKCFASVSGFPQTYGDVFYRAFQASARESKNGASLKLWGRYAHGRAEMGMSLSK